MIPKIISIGETKMAKECPKCHSKNLKEVEDKSKAIAYFGHRPVYRKKVVCRECTYEWDLESGPES